MARGPQNDRLIYRDDTCPVDTRIDPRELLAIPPVGNYTVNDIVQYRPALISFLLYRTPDFWWVLLDYNQITYTELVSGLIIRVPQEAAIRTLLERARRNRILLDGIGTATTLAGGAPTRRIVSL